MFVETIIAFTLFIIVSCICIRTEILLLLIPHQRALCMRTRYNNITSIFPHKIKFYFILFCQQVYQEFQIQLTDLTVENLLEQFTLSKHTGLEKPGRWERFIYEKSLRYSPLNRRKTSSSGATTSGTTRGKMTPVQLPTFFRAIKRLY